MYSREKILSLAPDPVSASKAVECAAPWRWEQAEGTERAVWGLYKTPAEPFRTMVDVEAGRFKCNCPSRKFPCKHGIGLLLLLLEKPDAFKYANEYPEDVKNWLEVRPKRNKPEVLSESKTAPEESPQDDWSWQKITTPDRLEEMAQGAQTLENWLLDLTRQGLAQALQQGPEMWTQVAARMVDAKLGGIAKRLRQMPALLQLPDWENRMVMELGSLHLFVRSFKKLQQLPPLLQCELLQIAGVNLKKEEVSKQNGIWDEWLVVSQVTGVEENLNYRRTWIFGQTSQRLALLLDYAFGSADFETRWQTATTFEGEVVYYPAAFPLRALVKTIESQGGTPKAPGGFTDLESFSAAYANALSKNPWLMHFPAVLEAVVPVIFENKWYLSSPGGRQQLPMTATGLNAWKILALSGGQAISVFGEWDGLVFQPLSVWVEERLVVLE